MLVEVRLPLLLHLERHVGAPQPLDVVQPVGQQSDGGRPGQLWVSHDDGLRPPASNSSIVVKTGLRADFISDLKLDQQGISIISVGSPPFRSWDLPILSGEN